MFVPEEYGGGSVSGSPVLDAAVISEELGRMIHPGPFRPTNIVAFAIAGYGTQAQKEEFLPGLASGTLVGTWAWEDGPIESTQLSAAPTRAEKDGDDYILVGGKTFVPYPHIADVLLVSAQVGDKSSQFLVRANTPGMEVEALECLDLSTRLGSLRLRDVRVSSASLLGGTAEATDAIERQLQLALLLQCADTNGATGFALDLTVEYAKERIAFGRPIGSYQALKHRLADHRMWLEGSYAITSYAAHRISEGRPDASMAARVAKAHVGKSSTAVLHDCVQIHGGIGMTWDYDLHLFFRRVISNEVLFGTPTHYQRELVDLLQGSVT
jgi:alkylation response protein AidB-like acyl-CoA dehydrogenase